MLGDKTLVGIVSWGKGCGQPDYPGKLQHFVINLLKILLIFRYFLIRCLHRSFGLYRMD